MKTDTATTVEPRMATAGPDLSDRVEQPLTLRPSVAPSAPQFDFMQVVQLALDKGYTAEQTERFIGMAEVQHKRLIRKAYDEAYTLFKGEAIRVNKSKTVTDGPLRGTKYATVKDFIDACTPTLSKFGLSHGWRVIRDDELIVVKVFLRHVDGHEESVELSAMPDIGPGRNKLQAKGSAITYCVRYGTEGLFGLKADDDDEDDGQGSDAEVNGKKRQDAAPLQRTPEHQQIIDGWKTLIRATATDAEAKMEWAGCSAAVKANPKDYDEMYAFTVAHRNHLKATKK